MAAKKEVKANVSARVSPSIKSRIEELAASEGRTVSQWLERLIVAHMISLAPPVTPQKRKRRRPEPGMDDH